MLCNKSTIQWNASILGIIFYANVNNVGKHYTTVI